MENTVAFDTRLVSKKEKHIEMVGSTGEQPTWGLDLTLDIE